ncbi:MAG TPA: prolyl oligopeptidase family serine peptidase [Egibacteraceae bacterium]|nr:prolyl oligopeptidase family serine peptidase [Egibacteraceae bacterium]
MALRYPATRSADQIDDYHGMLVADPYRWLEDVDSPETREWIAAQNTITSTWLEGCAARVELRDRLRALWDQPRAGAPWRRGERWFQLRNTGLQNQDVLWVLDSPGEAGRVLLDPNLGSDDGTVALSGAAVSEDGRLLAYATSAAGSDWMTWRVRDIDRGADLDDELVWSKFSSAAWTPDGQGFFYSAYDAPEAGAAYHQANRDQRLCFHRVGHPQENDELIYARADQPEWGFSPHVTDDGRWLVIEVWQGTERFNRVHVKDLEAGGDVAPLLDDFDAGYHYCGTDGARLYFRTDSGAPRGRIIAVDPMSPQRSAWVEVVAEGRDILESARLVSDRLVCTHLQHASHRLRVFGLDGAEAGEIPLPGLGTVGAVTGRRQDALLHFTFASFAEPSSVHRYELATQTATRVFAPRMDFDSSRIVTEQVWVASLDGAKIPMFVVHDRTVEPDGERPTLLWGYGGFDISITPAFKTEWAVWLERGGILAVPNLRGGGEYGQDWHDAGRLERKQNTFDDAIACARWLAESGWTRPERLAVAGRSNGGLLAAACLTQAPELFGAALVEVGVLDMLRFHQFTIGWAWASDYGCADDPEQFKWLLAYSPLHNLRPGTAYPATLITTGDHDDRVVPGHSFKFAAALQAAQDGDAPVLIRVETAAGHGAGKPTGKLIDERADVLAFLLHELAGEG